MPKAASTVTRARRRSVARLALSDVAWVRMLHGVRLRATTSPFGKADAMLIDALDAPAQRVATMLRERGETVAVAEGSAGGLISAALLAIPGASAYFLGGAVVYTARANRAWMTGAIETPPGLRGATEAFAGYLARSVAGKLDADWGLGEAGAAGPANPYGDPAGHCWVAAARADEVTTRHVLTGADDRPANMVAFAVAALDLLSSVLESSPA